jgi:hypothetical protein
MDLHKAVVAPSMRHSKWRIVWSRRRIDGAFRRLRLLFLFVASAPGRCPLRQEFRHVFQHLSEARNGGGERVEGLAAQCAQANPGHRLHGRRARRAAQGGHGTEGLPSVERGYVDCWRTGAHDAQPAFLDQIHRVAAIALPVGDLSRVQDDRLQLRPRDGGDGGRRQAGEGRHVTEERLKPPVLALQLDVRAEVRLRVGEFEEVGRLEPQRQHVGTGADRGETRHTFEQLGVAEAIAGAQHVEHDFVGISRLFDEARAAGDDDVERIWRCALGGHHGAEWKRGRYEALHDARPCVRRQIFQQGQVLEHVTHA